MPHRAQISSRFVVVVALLAAVAAGGYFLVRRMMLPAVQVTRALEGPVVQAFYATGTIVPEREYSVRSNIAGILALEPGIDKGVAIRKDQLIARVVSDDLEQKFKQAQAELKEKQARADETKSPVLEEFDKRIDAYQQILALAKRELARLTELSEQNVVKTLEIERAQDRVATTQSQLDATRAQRAAKLLEVKKDLEVAQGNFDIARWNLDQQEIKAPVDGVILDWPVPNRTRLAVNDPILTVADVRPQKLVMRANVDEEDKNKLHTGQMVRMTLYSFPDDKFTGRVKTVYAKADPQRRTFEVDVEIERPATRPATGPTSAPTTLPTTAPAHQRFSAGMTGELAFVEQEKPSTMILPRQALQGEWFYIVRGGRIARVAAQAGIRNVTRVEVLGGLEKDAQVIISPIGKLEEGQVVRTQWLDPRIAADLNKPKDDIFRGGF